MAFIIENQKFTLFAGIYLITFSTSPVTPDTPHTQNAKRP